MSSNYGTETQEHLRHWEEILHAWCDVIDRLCVIMMPSDRPWWASEIGNAGLIAAASIQCNVACFLETTVNREDRKGPCDLWLKFRNEPKKQYGSEQEFVELKLDDSGLESVSTWKLDEAMADARTIKEEQCRARIGACIYKITGQSPTIDISTLIRRFKETLDPHAIAWSFPESARVIADDSRYHLGAILVLKKVDNP